MREPCEGDGLQGFVPRTLSNTKRSAVVRRRAGAQNYCWSRFLQRVVSWCHSVSKTRVNAL
jgi:hypothetical protein